MNVATLVANLFSLLGSLLLLIPPLRIWNLYRKLGVDHTGVRSPDLIEALADWRKHIKWLSERITRTDFDLVVTGLILVFVSCAIQTAIAIYQIYRHL